MYRFEAFAWLQDDVAEAALCSQLSRLPVQRCTARHAAVRQGLVPAADAEDEVSSITRDHPPARYGAAWATNVSFNTLRMLFKLRGVERLRQRLLDAADPHEWVLRVRPDLELLDHLALPPPAHDGSIGYMPWQCATSHLTSDQLLLLPATVAATRLGALYDPSTLLSMAQLSSPPSLYPERLMHHALQGAVALRPWPGGAPLRLVGAGGEARDAYAKLRADFPECFREQ